MLIRMFVNSIILSVLLLAGISYCAAEEDGYDYSKPSIGFSYGSNSFGSQSIYTKPTEYVVASSTPKPAAVYNVKPQASTFVQYPSIQQYKAPIVTKPQTLFGGSSSFGQSSSSFGRPVSSLSQFGQKYQSQPQANFGAYQGYGQTSSTTGSGQYVSGQYKAPTISVTSKPQTNFGAYQGYGQTSSTTGSGQYVSGQYKAPTISVTSKPQTNLGAYQGLGQSSSTTGSGQYVSGQYKAPVISVTSKPQTNFGAYQGYGQTSSTTGSGQYVSGQYKAPTISVTSKPQTNFGAYQGFGQSTNQLSYATGTGQYQPAVSIVPKFKPTFTGSQGFSQSKPQQNVFIAKPIKVESIQSKPATVTVVKPTVVKPTYVKPTVVEATYVKPTVVQPTYVKPTVVEPTYVKPTYVKPTYVKPTYVKPTYVKPTVVQATYVKPIIVKPQPTSKPSSFGSFESLKPAIFKPKQQSSFSAFDGFGQKTNVLQPLQPLSFASALNGYGQSSSTFSQYQKPIVTPKPLTTYGSSQGSFGNLGPSYLPPSKPLIPATIKISPTLKPDLSPYNFQGSSSTIAPAVQTPVSTLSTPKPVAITAKPQTSFSAFQGSSVKPTLNTQTSFSGFQGFGQSSSKPAVVQYQKPVVYTTPKPIFKQPIVQYQKPLVSTPIKSQSSFGSFQGYGQTSYPKPTVSPTYAFSSTTVKPQVSYLPPKAQVQPISVFPSASEKYTRTPTTFKPVVITSKPQTAFSGFGQSVYQKPAISTFNTFGQQSATQYAVKPLTVTSKPQTAFSGFGQAVYKKPALSTFNTFGQQSSTRFSTTPTTFKPVIVTSKPQTAFSSFGQSVYQKPAVSTFNNFGQQSSTRYASTPTTFKPLAVTLKPQTAFSGFGQSVYQKPAVSTFGQQSATQFQIKPLTITPKPQSAFSGFGQSVYKKPAVNTFNTFGQQSSTRFSTTPTVKPFIVTAKPQTAFSSFGQSVYQKPAVTTFNNFGQQSAIKPLTAFSGFEQSVYQKPVIVSTTARPQELFVSTTLAPKPTLSPQSLTYLPPKGNNVPLNAVSASGAVSESFFELPSATANQVVDVAQEQKVGGYVVDLPYFISQSPEVQTITNQTSSDSAQEQKVEPIDLRANKLTATNEGQEQEFFSENNGVVSAPTHRNKRDAYSYGGYQADYAPPTGYLSYQGNPITTQQFGGVQPNSYQGVPYQQIAQAQSSLGITDRTVLGQESYLQPEQGSTSNGAPNQDPYNFERQYDGYISSIEDQQQQIPQNYEEAATYTDAVNTKITDESPVQDPKPLNREEQQIRQVEEKPENNFQNIEPGSYIGPHVNKNSDHEYNVFDYDQYSKDPEDADV